MTKINVRTNPRLLKSLRKAAKTKMTAHEQCQQRVSFIFSSMGDKSHVTREKVKELLEKESA